MKTMLGLMAYSVLFLSQVTLADPIQGFEDPNALAKIMNGEILVTDAVETKVEFRSFVRAYFNKVSPDAYIDVLTNHEMWSELIPEVKEGKTTNVNADKTVFDWWLHMKIKYGFLTFNVYPEGQQTVYRAVDTKSEAKVRNVITSHQDYIKEATQTTRLIPYQNGFLVEDNIHVVIHKPSNQADTIKKELKKTFVNLIGSIREELQGDY